MPSIPETLNAAVAHHQAGRLQQAERLYRDILKADPKQADAWHLLGLIAHQVGRQDAAVESIGQAISLRPNAAAFHNSLGVALAAAGRFDRAVASYQRALQIQPDSSEAHNNLGVVLYDQNRLEEAAARYEQAVGLKPEYADAYRNLGNVRKRLGEHEAAIAAYERALRISPGNVLRFTAATVLPVIYESVDEMQVFRKRLVDGLRSLADDGVRFDPLAVKLPHTFHLAYQGENDRDIQELIASLCAESSQDLSKDRQSLPAGGEKIRIGFISTFFHAHTVSKVWRGVIARLSRERFEVCVLSLETVDDPISREIRKDADRFIELPKDLGAARRQIAEQRLDILYYTDVGMHPATYALAVSRLAPVQCVTWGHPVTTGLSTMDYYVSSELLETDEAETHYTERLVRLKRLGVYYHRPHYPPPKKTRSDFGLPDEMHVYACLQSSFKLDPDYDRLLSGILRRDPRGLLVLARGMCPRWDQLLHERFTKTIPDVLDRIRFLPRQAYNDYLRLINVVDVLLVPTRFGGGSTSYEALAFGVPVVTLPSALLRGRITLALYRQMDVFDCVAESPEDYVDIAVRLGTDPRFRTHVRDKILAAGHLLFEDDAAVREVEEFLMQAVQRARAG